VIKFYRDRDPAPFRAVQYDGENGMEIIEFTERAAFWDIPGYQDEPVLYLREPDMTEELPVGYWVIQGEGRRPGDDTVFYMSYEPGEFEIDFEPSCDCS
jgi:hypothetical protein